MSDADAKILYLIGSLRNERIPRLAAEIRKEHPAVEVFDDWFAAGPEADDWWKRYEQGRGRSYEEALSGYAAKHVFDFDRFHLDRATHVLLVLPAGKSGHMEVMYGAYGAKGEPKTAILLDPEDVRWDVMYQFVDTVLSDDSKIGEWLDEELTTRQPRREEQLPDGIRPFGLLPECSGGGSPPVIRRDAAASSWL